MWLLSRRRRPRSLGALLGHFLLREPFDRRRLAATALVLAGILTLQLAR